MYMPCLRLLEIEPIESRVPEDCGILLLMTITFCQIYEATRYSCNQR